MRPFKYPLPAELQLYKSLFSRCGVQDKFNVSTLTDVLRDINDKHSAKRKKGQNQRPCSFPAQHQNHASSSRKKRKARDNKALTGTMCPYQPTNDITLRVQTFGEQNGLVFVAAGDETAKKEVSRDLQLSVDILNQLKIAAHDLGIKVFQVHAFSHFLPSNQRLDNEVQSTQFVLTVLEKNKNKAIKMGKKKKKVKNS